MIQARTISGRHVEIVTILPPGQELDDGQSIIGIFTDSDGARSVETWTREGRYLGIRNSPLDLRLAVAPEYVVCVTCGIEIGADETLPCSAIGCPIKSEYAPAAAREDA